MNKLIIIGNGFDLAHGLKTSFKDFLNYCVSESLNEYEQHIMLNGYLERINILQEDNLTEKYSDVMTNDNLYRLYKIKKNLYQLCYSQSFNEKQNKVILKKFEHMLSYNIFIKFILNRINSDSTWGGVENDFYEALIHVSGIKSSSNLSSITSSLTGFFYINKLNEAFKKMINHLYVYLDMQDSVTISQKIFKIFEQIFSNHYYGSNLVLNFNYTKTFDLYKEHFSNTKVIHIHGELNNKDNPIIFGYGDDNDEHYSTLENLKDNAYLKFAKSLHYQLTDNYKQLLNFINADKYEICIIGHSCGSSDKVLLSTIFEHEN